MAKYVIDEATLKDIADTIRECSSWDGEWEEAVITPLDMPRAVRDIRQDGYWEGEYMGVKQGKQQANNYFWETYLARCEKEGFIYAFSGYGITDEIYNPTRPIRITGSTQSQYAFSHAIALTNTKVPMIIDNSNQYLTHIFNWCYSLKTIPSIKVTEKVCTFSSWFYQCTALEEINFTEDSVIAADISFSHSSNLTNASVASIIHALKDLTGAMAKTLTLHATVGGKLTEEQKAAITAKNWTLVY